MQVFAEELRRAGIAIPKGPTSVAELELILEESLRESDRDV